MPLRLPGCAARERNSSGEHFWAWGYAVSAVGFELEQVREYIRAQDAAGKRLMVGARTGTRMNFEGQVGRRTTAYF